MTNIVIGYNNRIDLATLSGGAWSATLPQSNLQSRLISKVARTASTGTIDTVIKIDFGTAYAIGVWALIAHNLSVAATVRVRANSSASMTSPLYDSTALPVWPSGLIPTDLCEWEDDNFWAGTLSAQARAGFQAPYICLNTGRTVARYAQIDIADAANSDGYVQVGRLFTSDTWSPVHNYLYGAGLSYVDPTQIDVSVAGEEFFDARNRYRVHKLKLGWITESEAYNHALEMQRLLGVSGEVLVIPDPSDAVNGVRRNFVGRMQSLSPVTIDPGNIFGVELEIRELL